MKEKTAKVIMITSLSIIGVLILSVILLAVISVNHGFSFNENRKISDASFNQMPDTIVVHNGSQSTILYSDKIEEQDGVFNDVFNAVKDAGNFKIIDSIFGGYASKNPGVEYLSSSVTFSSLYSATGDYCVEFRWHAAQKINYQNGDETVEYSYDRAYFAVTEGDAVTKVSAYLKAYNTSNTYSRVVYYAYLNTSNLYEVVQGLDYNA